MPRPYLYNISWVSRNRLVFIFIGCVVLLTLTLKTFWSSGATPPFPTVYTQTPSPERCRQAEEYKSTKTSPTSGNEVEGFLPLAEAEQLCSSHGLKPYKERTKPRKVYDLFLFNTEFDWLEIRINELSKQVDNFILLEAMQTFSDKPKPLYYDRNKGCLLDLAPDKLVYHALDLAEVDHGWWSPNWSREKYARNAMFSSVFPFLTGTSAPNYKDVILVSDVDEIPRPETIRVLRNCEFPKKTNLRSRFYYYSYQWEHHSKDWEHPQVTWYDGLDKTIQPNDLRWGYKSANWNFPNSSWHCSSCFATVAEMEYKIASFSHQEFNQEKFREPSEIVRRVRNGLDLFDRRKEIYDRQDPVIDYPQYLRQAGNDQRFGFLLNRDPENANFQDFP
jgi:beta-1,4-mannosyl-glycoprotein beta-1,4-N-acetylglucosaminyltransferase